MLMQVRFGSKFCRTDGTLIRFFPRVRPDMGLHRISGDAAVGAERTGVRLLFRVDITNVSPQICLIVAFVGAKLTSKYSRRRFEEIFLREGWHVSRTHWKKRLIHTFFIELRLLRNIDEIRVTNCLILELN